MKHRNLISQHVMTLFLKTAIVALGAVGLLLYVLLLPSIYREFGSELPGFAHFKGLVVFGLSLTIIPFFIALIQSFRLLHMIDTNRAFSHQSVVALRTIKRSTTIFALLHTLFALPVFYYAAEIDDAPGLVIVGLLFVCAAFAVAGFAAILEMLLSNAVAIKNENELTV